MTPAPTEPCPPIGGFFEASAPEAAKGVSVLAAWTSGRPFAAFVSARAAFAALVAQHPRAAIWAPAYVCPDLLQGISGSRVRFYPMAADFAPDLATVEAQALAGDIVVLVAHFGLPPTAEARAFAERRGGDVVIVEDRAQALGADLPDTGRYQLYSPRKLLGVADGGILVAANAEASLPQPEAASDAQALWLPAKMRQDDRLGRDNARWHAANQAKEAAMPVDPLAMTEASRTILTTTAVAPLAQARLANWLALDARLARWSALPPSVKHPPLGYVLRLPPKTRHALRQALHAQRIFAAVHWLRIAAPERDFPREWAWTRELITLPCDHRYGRFEMDRIAAVVEEQLG